MLIPSFFIPVFDNAAAIAGNNYPENSCLVFEIKTGDIVNLTALYKSLFSGVVNTSFCILVQAGDVYYDEKEMEIFVDHIVSFTFHYKYLSLNIKKPLLFFKSNAYPQEDRISLFREKFKGQGFDDFNYVHMNACNEVLGSNVEGKWVSLEQPGTKTLLSSAYAALFKNMADPAGFLLFYVDSPDYLNTLLNDLQQVEDKLSMESPDIYVLLRKNLMLKEKQKALLLHQEVLMENIDSLQKYYTFYNEPDSGYKKKITEVIDFYKNEYEILPLWYKRFGHIIKVLAGKRTFRSLFDDNVKKYKV